MNICFPHHISHAVATCMPYCTKGTLDLGPNIIVHADFLKNSLFDGALFLIQISIMYLSPNKDHQRILLKIGSNFLSTKYLL